MLTTCEFTKKEYELNWDEFILVGFDPEVIKLTHVKMASNSGVLVQFIVILSISGIIIANWDTNDYLKREHSLVKPFTSNVIFHFLK